MLGTGATLTDWNIETPVQMHKDGDWWVANLDLSESSFPLAYKYGVYDGKEKQFIGYEEGDNRVLYSDASRKKLSVIHDGFVHLPNNIWKGAGVAIPVFSLKTKNSFGVGEFTDLKLLVDWAVQTGLKLIQILPVNDTIATNNWKDSYPYAAISAFALHPLYINLSKVAGKKEAAKVNALKKKQKQLNELNDVDYEEVMKFKLLMLNELFEVMGGECFESDGYKKYYEDNKDWLNPYAAYCYFRDKYRSPDISEWKTNGIYQKSDIDALLNSPATSKSLGFYFLLNIICIFS
jgi:4-alpha-glucanotransferase